MLCEAQVRQGRGGQKCPSCCPAMAETLLNALEDWDGTTGAEEGILEDHGYVR